MTLYLFSALINLGIALLILFLAILVIALTLLVLATTAGQIRKVAVLTLQDIINIRSLWLQSINDTNNNQVLAELQQKKLAQEIHHQGKMLEAEADTALMPIRRERLELLAAVEES
jgi:hypothetical protein